MCSRRSSSRCSCSSVPNASRKRSKGNLESIKSLEPPGIATVISGIPEESESVVERCATYSWPSRSPACSRRSSNCASPNFPRVCELASAPAIFLVSSKNVVDAFRISSIVPTNCTSDAILFSDASCACRRIRSTVLFISSICVAIFVSFSLLASAAFRRSSDALSKTFTSLSSWLIADVLPPLAADLILEIHRPSARPIMRPRMRVIKVTTVLDMGQSWQEALTIPRRLSYL